MTVYQYKTVAAPRRVSRVKGVKGRDALTAHAIGELISVEASQGWEYQRTDTFPIEEKVGFFSKPVITERAVLIFRKAVVQQPQVQPQPQMRQPAPQPAPAPQPHVQAQPQPQPHPHRAEPAAPTAEVEPAAPRIGGAND